MDLALGISRQAEIGTANTALRTMGEYDFGLIVRCDGSGRSRACTARRPRLHAARSRSGLRLRIWTCFRMGPASGQSTAAKAASHRLPAP
jgi:hypothetical protein